MDVLRSEQSDYIFAGLGLAFNRHLTLRPGASFDTGLTGSMQCLDDSSPQLEGN